MARKHFYLSLIHLLYSLQVQHRFLLFYRRLLPTLLLYSLNLRHLRKNKLETSQLLIQIFEVSLHFTHQVKVVLGKLGKKLSYWLKIDRTN